MLIKIQLKSYPLDFSVHTAQRKGVLIIDTPVDESCRTSGNETFVFSVAQTVRSPIQRLVTVSLMSQHRKSWAGIDAPYLVRSLGGIPRRGVELVVNIEDGAYACGCADYAKRAAQASRGLRVCRSGCRTEYGLLRAVLCVRSPRG